MNRQQYDQVTDDEFHSVVRVYKKVIALIMRCEEAQNTFSLQDGITICTIYIINEVSKITTDNERNFKMRFDKIFGENSTMMSMADELDKNATTTQRLDGSKICNSMLDAKRGLRTAEPPTQEDLENFRMELFREGHYQDDAVKKMYTQTLEQFKWQWHIKHFPNTVSMHDDSIDTIAVHVLTTCFPAIAHGMHHVSQFENVGDYELVHKYKVLFEYHVKADTKLNRLEGEGVNYARAVQSARTEMQELENMIIKSPEALFDSERSEEDPVSTGQRQTASKNSSYKHSLDFWKKIESEKSITEAGTNKEAVFFWTALKKVHGSEQKFMHKQIEVIWKQLMHTPYYSGHPYPNPLARVDKSLRFSKDAPITNFVEKKKIKNNPKAPVFVPAEALSPYYGQNWNHTLSAKMMAIKPKFTDMKFRSTNVFKRIPDMSTEQTSKLLEDKPVTEMAEVQARFSDLIF
jgi:hypothetical protein